MSASSQDVKFGPTAAGHLPSGIMLITHHLEDGTYAGIWWWKPCLMNVAFHCFGPSYVNNLCRPPPLRRCASVHAYQPQCLAALLHLAFPALLLIESEKWLKKARSFPDDFFQGQSSSLTG